MKKILSICVIFLFALMSCNSGSSNKTTTSDSTVVSPDTTHASMNMTVESPLPEIPADASVSFKNLHLFLPGNPLVEDIQHSQCHWLTTNRQDSCYQPPDHSQSIL